MVVRTYEDLLDASPSRKLDTAVQNEDGSKHNASKKLAAASGTALAAAGAAAISMALDLLETTEPDVLLLAASVGLTGQSVCMYFV